MDEEHPWRIATSPSGRPLSTTPKLSEVLNRDRATGHFVNGYRVRGSAPTPPRGSSHHADARDGAGSIQSTFNWCSESTADAVGLSTGLSCFRFGSSSVPGSRFRVQSDRSSSPPASII
jgi:hypothetical protein